MVRSFEFEEVTLNRSLKKEQAAQRELKGGHSRSKGPEEEQSNSVMGKMGLCSLEKMNNSQGRDEEEAVVKDQTQEGSCSVQALDFTFRASQNADIDQLLEQLGHHLHLSI